MPIDRRHNYKTICLHQFFIDDREIIAKNAGSLLAARSPAICTYPTGLQRTPVELNCFSLFTGTQYSLQNHFFCICCQPILIWACPKDQNHSFSFLLSRIVNRQNSAVRVITAWTADNSLTRFDLRARRCGSCRERNWLDLPDNIHDSPVSRLNNFHDTIQKLHTIRPRRWNKQYPAIPQSYGFPHHLSGLPPAGRDEQD